MKSHVNSQTSPLRALGALLAITLVSQTAATAQITLTFNGGGGASSPVTLSGYQISLNSDGFSANGFPNSPLYIGNAGAQATLTRTDAGQFNLSSMIIYSGDPNQNITFTGTLFGGGTVTDTFTHSGAVAGGITTTLPSTFDDLVSVSWDQGSAPVNSYAFNNLVVTSVPEPGVMGMATVGGLLLAFARSRRNR